MPSDRLEINFIPSKRYRDQKLAPEKIDQDVIVEAAKATRKAVDAGVLTPALANLVLPNLLNEKRLDYGVNAGQFYAKNPAVAKIIKALGLEGNVMSKKDAERMDAEDKAAGIRNMNPRMADSLMINPREPDSKLPGGLSGLAHNAKLMTAVLGMKEADASDPADAIKRWNGSGPGAENHKQKVLETSAMLNDPINAAILNLFRDSYNSATGVK